MYNSAIFNSGTIFSSEYLYTNSLLMYSINNNNIGVLIISSKLECGALNLILSRSFCKYNFKAKYRYMIIKNYESCLYN